MARLVVKVFRSIIGGKMAWYSVWLGSFLLAASLVAQLDAADEALPLTKLAEQLTPALVLIRSSDRDGNDDYGVGTGFVISSEGLIATNLHVIGEGRPFRVEAADGKPLTVVAVHAADHHLDLAIIRVKPERPLRALTLAEEPLPVGAPLAAVGHPFGLKSSVVAGVLSGRRVMDGRQMLQLAMPVEPGNSGGPVVDRRGQVHGIVTLKSALTENLGFATDVSALRTLLERPNPVAIDRWVRLGQLPSHVWQPHLGARWRYRGGIIHVEEPGTGFGGRSLCLWQASVPQDSFAVEVDVRLSRESGAAGLVFYCDEQMRHYGFYPSQSRMRLTCFKGPTVYEWEILREAPTAAYRPGDWNTLRVEVQGPLMRCVVNGSLVFVQQDTTLRGGRVGLVKFRDTAADFRRFRVQPLTDTTSEPSRNPLWADLRNHLVDAREISEQLVAPLLNRPETPLWLRREEEHLQRQLAALREVGAEWHLQTALNHLEKALAEPVDLLRAALWIAYIDDPDVDPDAYVEQVEQMAREITNSLPAGADPATRLAALDKYLFEDNGFHGSRHDYYHRANSHLHRVLMDREGLPITLSLLYIELAKRLDLTVDGIALPGHFIVRFRPSNGSAEWIDVFERGKKLSIEDVRQMVRKELGDDQPADTFLEPATPRQILERILRNLLNSAERDNEPQAMRRYLEALVKLDPNNVQYRGMRALTRYHTGRRQGAIADLDWFLTHQPRGVDLERIRQMREVFASELAEP